MRVEADQKSQSIEPQRHHTGAAPSGETDANGARHREQIALQEQTVCFCLLPLNSNWDTFEKQPFLIETVYRKAQ